MLILQLDLNLWCVIVFEPIKRHNCYLFHLMAGVRNMLYEYSYHHSAYEQVKGKRTLPAIQYVDTQYKSPRTNVSSSAVYSSQTKTSRMPTTAPRKTLRRDTFQQEYCPSLSIKKDVNHVGAFTEQRERRTVPSPYLIRQKRDAQLGTAPERSRREAGNTVLFSKESTTVQKEASPSISESVRKEDVPTFSSYNLHSASNQTKYERPIGRTRTINEKTSDHQVAEEQTSVLLEERGMKEKLTKERIPSDVEKVSEKPAPVGRNAHVEQRAEIKQRTAEKKHVTEELSIEQNRKDDTVVKHKTPQDDGSYIRWEERIQTDASEKRLPADKKVEGSPSFQKRNVSVTTQIKETAEISAQSEVHDRECTLKSDNVEITLQGVRSTVGNQKLESTFQSTGESNRGGGSEEASSKIGTFVRESIAENIVSDILKDFVPKSSDPRLPSATFQKKDISEDEKVKTKANAQGRVQDDLKASDYFDLVGFLKRDAQKVLEDHQGTQHKDVVEDTVDANEEGKFKKTVQVEIVEETFGSTSGDRMEFSTPFEVVEAEDTMPGMAAYPDDYDEGKATKSTAKGLKEKRPSVVVSHVEEVAEGDEEVDEEKYYVSTPDEYPLGHEQDKDSIYGQIHIEEESSVKYSWQDEFLPGSQTKINESLDSPELVYQVMRGEKGAYISNEEVPKEQVACAETIVIEKEIKIPHEFQDTIKGLLSQESKDPKQQLKEALEKLEDTLPESVKQELSAITKESDAESSTLEVDIRKVEGTKKGGSVTIVAEVNLSQTLDSDQFNMEFLGEGLADQIKLPSSEDGLEEHRKQEPERREDGRNKVQVDVSSTPWTVKELSSSAKLSSPDGTKHISSEQIIYQGPVFKSTETTSGGDEHLSQTSFDINRRIKQIVIAPTEVHRTEHVLYEGPVAGGSQFGGEDFATETSADASQSVKEFKHSPKEIQTTETIIVRGPVHKTVEVSGSESTPQVQFSTDIRSSGRVSLSSKQIVEEVGFEGPASDLSPTNSSEAFFQMKGPAETSRSVRHIRIDPQEVHSEHVVYEGHFPGVVDGSSSGDHILAEKSVRHIRIGQQETRMSEQTLYEESPTETAEPSLKDGELDSSTTIRRIKLSPKEFVTEQIVFTGPTSEQHLEFSGPRHDSPTGSVRHIKLGQAGVQSGEHAVFHGSFSESSGISSPGEDALEEGGPIDVSRTTRHIRLSSSETPAEQIAFHGPISETVCVSTAEPPPTDGPSESSSPVGQIKIGAKEASFTFQMDVTNVAGGRQEATILIPGKKEVRADSSEASTKGGQGEKESDQGSEELTFHQSVQLQRMVDQRSVISDEKKIALLYLNEGEGEEEEEEDGPWF